MRILREWIVRFLHPGRRDSDLTEELRSHRDLAAERGRRVGGTAQPMDALRDQRGLPWLDDLRRDLRHAVRTLWRSPGFSLTAVLSLALGIGASAGIFSLLDQVLLRQLPVRQPERLVQMGWNGTSISANWGGGHLLSYPLCRDLEAQAAIFEGVFCRHPTGVNFSTGEGQDDASAEIVSGSYFHVLGVQPALGRLIDPSDDRQPGAHAVVVLAHDYWMNSLGGAPDVIGRRVLINNHPMTVIGVAPPAFRGLDVGVSTDLWLPAMMKRQATPEWDELFDRRAFWMHVLGRLKPDGTAEQARAGLQPWFKSMLAADTQLEGFPTLSAEQRDRFMASTIDVLPASRGLSTLRGTMDRPLRVLMAGTALLLLLASVNVAGLLIARGAARRGELMTRLALGASRRRLVTQLLVESLCITAAGGAVGLLAAPAVSQLLLSFVPQNVTLTTSIDRRVFAFALLTSLVTTAVCALAPLVLTRQLAPIAPLKERSGGTIPGGARLRKLLVASQMAFVLILLTGAGLFVQTLARLQEKGAGFDGRSLVMFSVDPLSLGYPALAAEQAMREVLRRVQASPGVERAAVANTQILAGGTSSTMFTIQAEERRTTDRVVHYMRVGPGFLSTVGAALIAGRDFDERDVRPDKNAPGPYRSIIVNETFARRYFGDRSPLGYRVAFGNRPDAKPTTEIIGVVRGFSRRNLRDEALEQAFVPFWDRNSTDGAFYVRIRTDAESVFASIRAAVAAVDRNLPVRSMTTFEDQIDRSLTTERALATLSSGFGVIALLIAVVGLYGVMAFVATQQAPEISLRLALGAARSGMLARVMKQGLILTGVGLAIGLAGALALNRLIASLLFGVRPTDPMTLVAVTLAIAAVAALACWLPAWRASRLDPNVVLRGE